LLSFFTCRNAPACSRQAAARSNFMKIRIVPPEAGCSKYAQNYLSLSLQEREGAPMVIRGEVYHSHYITNPSGGLIQIPQCNLFSTGGVLSIKEENYENVQFKDKNSTNNQHITACYYGYGAHHTEL
jgi:hypothetical protein